MTSSLRSSAAGRLPPAWLWVHDIISHDVLVFAAAQAQTGCWVQGLAQFSPVRVYAAKSSLTSAAY